jgi:hypothetical protein
MFRSRLGHYSQGATFIATAVRWEERRNHLAILYTDNPADPSSGVLPPLVPIPCRFMLFNFNFPD